MKIELIEKNETRKPTLLLVGHTQCGVYASDENGQIFYIKINTGCVLRYNRATDTLSSANFDDLDSIENAGIFVRLTNKTFCLEV